MEQVPFVHRCIRSPMFMTMASFTGGASINSPVLWGFSICREILRPLLFLLLGN